MQHRRQQSSKYPVAPTSQLYCNALQELGGESTIVFTSSIEATHRLYLLLAALGCLADRVVEFSSLVPPAERAANLEAFRSGAAKVGSGVVVCSAASQQVCEAGAGRGSIRGSMRGGLGTTALQLSTSRWLPMMADQRLCTLRSAQPVRHCSCVQVLVCSDAMTRGMDVEGVQASSQLCLGGGLLA